MPKMRLERHYARSNRAQCKICRQLIKKGQLVMWGMTGSFQGPVSGYAHCKPEECNNMVFITKDEEAKV